MENRELEFKEAVLVAVKVLSSFCFPHLQRESSIAAGELEMAVQRIHHLVTLEREPALPEDEKPASATSLGEVSMGSRLGKQALSALVRAGYVFCQVRHCMNPATHLSDGDSLPFCEKHKAAVALELAHNLGLITQLPHESSTR